MSRVASRPVELPDGVECSIAGNTVSMKGSKGEMQYQWHALVSVKQDGNKLNVSVNDDSKTAGVLAGTTRALLKNIVTGVNVGFERRLTIIGVGYRAQLKDKFIDLTLGFSHTVRFDIPEGITVEVPSQTDILIKGSDKQQVGQVAANIRAYRPPENYKGKGIRYSDENVLIKEAKKT